MGVGDTVGLVVGLLILCTVREAKPRTVALQPCIPSSATTRLVLLAPPASSFECVPDTPATPSHTSSCMHVDWTKARGCALPPVMYRLCTSWWRLAYLPGKQLQSMPIYLDICPTCCYFAWQASHMAVFYWKRHHATGDDNNMETAVNPNYDLATTKRYVRLSTSTYPCANLHTLTYVVQDMVLDAIPSVFCRTPHVALVYPTMPSLNRLHGNAFARVGPLQCNPCTFVCHAQRVYIQHTSALTCSSASALVCRMAQ